jgi:GrpB-like predicted nucleotidyltransferase (UPF0157 family)/chloramphenicol 3-O-phosphotransferase
MNGATATAGIYLITGPMAAGKSTVAHLLAQRFPRGVHLEGDFFRRSIVSGRLEMTPNSSAEAVEQLRFRYRLAGASADAYFEAGFTVALEDVVAGPLLSEYRRMIRGRPCHVIVLMPSLDALASREADRKQKGYTRWTVEEFYEGFRETTPPVGLWLDTSGQTADETVDEILARTPLKRQPLVVVDYEAEWPTRFEEIAAPIRRALGEIVVTVDHVGSTSVEGLVAKPVIDVDVVVHSNQELPVAIEQLRQLGYIYQGNKGIFGQEAFWWPPETPAHHLYVVVEGTKPHVDHIRFRDYLRHHPEVAHEYAELKRRLAQQHRYDREAYTNGKTAFITRVLAADRQ